MAVTAVLLCRYGRFAPNAPSVLRGSIPGEERRGRANMQTLLDTLPTRIQVYTTAQYFTLFALVVVVM